MSGTPPRRPRRATGGTPPPASGGAERTDPTDEEQRLTSRPSGTTHEATPVLPVRSADDADVGWGERPDADHGDDERLLREKPPHW